MTQFKKKNLLTYSVMKTKYSGSSTPSLLLRILQTSYEKLQKLENKKTQNTNVIFKYLTSFGKCNWGQPLRRQRTNSLVSHTQDGYCQTESFLLLKSPQGRRQSIFLPCSSSPVKEYLHIILPRQTNDAIHSSIGDHK